MGFRAEDRAEAEVRSSLRTEGARAQGTSPSLVQEEPRTQGPLRSLDLQGQAPGSCGPAGRTRLAC